MVIISVADFYGPEITVHKLELPGHATVSTLLSMLVPAKGEIAVIVHKGKPLRLDAPLLQGVKLELRVLKDYAEGRVELKECLRIQRELGCMGLPKGLLKESDFSQLLSRVKDPDPDQPPKARLMECVVQYQFLFDFVKSPPKNFCSWQLLSNYNHKENQSTRIDMPSKLQVQLVKPRQDAPPSQFSRSIVWNVLTGNVELQAVDFNWEDGQDKSTIGGSVVLQNKTADDINLDFTSGLLWSYRTVANKKEDSWQDIVTRGTQYGLPSRGKARVPLRGFCANKKTDAPSRKPARYDLTPWRLCGFNDQLGQGQVWRITK